MKGSHGVRRAAAGALLLAVALPAAALEFSPRLEGEGRWFFQADGEPGARTGSVAATLEFLHEWPGGDERVEAELFGRWDADDPERTHFDVRELYYHAIGEVFEFRMGNRRVFWGVTESRHLVDIINQTDFVEDLDAESKLGQPMMNLALIGDPGTLDLFLMPYQPARTFPGDEGRPRLPFPVHEHEAVYESRRGPHHMDWAARWVKSLGAADLGVAVFDGTAREPRLVPCLRRGSPFQGTADGPNCDILSGIQPPSSPVPEELVPLLQAAGLAPSDEDVARQIAQQVIDNLVLVPHYDRLRQVSLEAQYVIESLALKLEAAYREERDRSTRAAVAGFEYTFGDVGGTGWDIGVLGEYLHDTKRDFLNLFDDEVFVGTRVALNDVAGTQLLAGVVAQREDFRNRLYGVEASRRLGDDWKVSLESRIFSAIPEGASTGFLADQDFVTLVLERFF